MAVIVEKDTQGRPRFRSVAFPPSAEDRELAVELDRQLAKGIPAIETDLTAKGLLERELPQPGGQPRKGNIELWWNLGSRLAPFVEDTRLVIPRERVFLWDAIRMYATPRILRKDRGPSRVHLDYCYRLSRFPWSFVKRLQWDDWVFFIDSKSLRQERRIDSWMRKRIRDLGGLGRQGFRDLAKELNRRLKDKDTTVFSDDELFAIYDKALELTERRGAQETEDPT